MNLEYKIYDAIKFELKQEGVNLSNESSQKLASEITKHVLELFEIYMSEKTIDTSAIYKEIEDIKPDFYPGNGTPPKYFDELNYSAAVSPTGKQVYYRLERALCKKLNNLKLSIQKFLIDRSGNTMVNSDQ